MKKKVVSLLTAMALTAMTLAGCGSSTAADSTDSTAAELTRKQMLTAPLQLPT